MPSLQNVLSQVPFLAGYEAQNQIGQQQGAQQLQQLGVLAQLQQQMAQQAEKQKAAQKAAAYDAEVAAAQGDPVKLREIAMRRANPADILRATQPEKASQPLADNRPEVLKLTEVLETLTPNHPARQFIISRLEGLGAKPEKVQNQSNLSRLIAERDALPQGDPRRMAYDNAIRKESEIQKQIVPQIINPPAEQPPVAIIGPDGKPVFVKRADAIGKSPAVRETADRVIPANIAKAYTENATALRKIDSALSEVDKYPDAFGLQNVVGDAVMQRADPKGVTARAIVADIGSLKIHDRSGAAVTAAETPRLLPFIPNANDKPATIKKKLALFRKEYADIQNDIGSMYSTEQGYRALPNAQTRASDKTKLKFDAQGNPVP